MAHEEGILLLADEIAFKIEHEILAGGFQPGEKLRQEALCKRFRVSRTPIREALRKLERLRLVAIAPNRGAVVRTPSRREVEEVFDIRGALEAHAAERACERGSAALDRALDQAIALLEHSAITTGSLDPNSHAANKAMSAAIRRFHRVIIDAADNARLAEMTGELERMYLGDFCCHALKLDGEREVLHVDEHKGIRDAIRLRQPRAASELMRAHLQHAKAVLIADLEASEFWTRPSRLATRRHRSAKRDDRLGAQDSAGPG